MQKQKNFVKTQIRIPTELHQLIIEFSENYDISMNTAIIDALEAGLIVAAETNNKTGTPMMRSLQRMALFCGDYNGNSYEESMLLVNNFFQQHPEYNLINLQIKPDAKSVYFFYEIPVHEDKRMNK